MWNPNLANVVAIPLLGEEEVHDGVSTRPVIGYVEGVHVNLPEALMVDALEAARVEPATPRFQIAGVETAYLRFLDEAAAEAAARAAGLWTATEVD